MADEVDLAQVAEDVASNVHRELALESASPRIKELAAEARQARSDIIAAGRQGEADMADLATKRDIYAPPGWDRLRREAINEAQAKMSEAFRRHERINAEIREAALSESLPRLDPAREALAREEFRTAIGEANGSKAVTRLMSVVRQGSHEAASVAFTPYAETVLQARGVTGTELADAQTTLRVLAAARALEDPQSEKQLLHASIYRDAGKLSAVRVAASQYVDDVIRKAGGTPIYG